MNERTIEEIPTRGGEPKPICGAGSEPCDITRETDEPAIPWALDVRMTSRAANEWFFDFGKEEPVYS
jgi:hypothetical protein